MGNEPPERSEPAGEARLPRGRLFELLANERRRAVVGHLRGASAPVALADLAAAIAEREAESAAAAEDCQTAVHRSLHHWHVPKLADAGVVEHDRDRGTVEPGAAFERVAPLVDDGQPLDASASER